MGGVGADAALVRLIMGPYWTILKGKMGGCVHGGLAGLARLAGVGV